jgi:imidazolonepropionase-like amidohydrolase
MNGAIIGPLARGARAALTAAFALGGVLGAAAEPTPLAGDAVIEASGYVAADGQIARLPRLLIADGKIAALEGDAPRGARIDAYPTGAVVSPGLIDAAAALGALDGLGERGQAIQPAVRAADAFNRHSSQIAAALAAGVTAFALAPDDSNLIGGQVAICLTAGGPEGRAALLETAGRSGCYARG